ncbi:hypothetical protein [Bifidobacterium simiarum]|uniref:hypothetical protein n=1 Tax=Bifidobacterium simiarum TaxID=2045441 RepID=UPI001BDCDB8B|nr:hypothetical protein [Bifidobacterium simiarum]MBT1167273.1 hypothetical protein [Bifidobacterium simiarum]
MGITINHRHSPATELAWDGCHKIYLLDNGDREADTYLLDAYRIRPIRDLETVWNHSCPLRFISSWDLTVRYAEQGETHVEFHPDPTDE